MLHFYDEHYHYHIPSDVEKFLGITIIGRLVKRPPEDPTNISQSQAAESYHRSSLMASYSK